MIHRHRSCPNCNGRDRKKILVRANDIYDICENCGYVFEESKVSGTKEFWKMMDYILNI